MNTATIQFNDENQKQEIVNLAKKLGLTISFKKNNNKISKKTKFLADFKLSLKQYKEGKASPISKLYEQL